MIALNKTAKKSGGLFRTLRKHLILTGAFIASLLVAFYWGAIASNRYVSQSHVIIQSTDMGGGLKPDIGSMLGNAGGLANRPDNLLLRDYLLSIDMLKKLDAKLDLRSHYSDKQRDLYSRMWFKDAVLEKFYAYYLTMVDIEFDDYAGVLIIKAQAFDPQTAYAINAMFVEEGERFMNDLGHGLAQEKVDFLSQEIAKLREKTLQARQALLNYQNKNSMVSPQASTENVVNIINQLEAQLTQLQANRASMLGYLVPDSANVAQVDFQIDAIEKQITREKSRLTSPKGKTLNSAVEEYQRLEMNAQFAQDMYKTALESLETGRYEASRTLKKMSILQAPNVPEYSLEPRRIHNTIVFILVTLVIAGIAHLLAAIIRDHKD